MYELLSGLWSPHSNCTQGAGRDDPLATPLATRLRLLQPPRLGSVHVSVLRDGSVPRLLWTPPLTCTVKLRPTIAASGAQGAIRTANGQDRSEATWPKEYIRKFGQVASGLGPKRSDTTYQSVSVLYEMARPDTLGVLPINTARLRG